MNLSKIDQDLRKNPTEATIVVYGYFPGSTDLWWDDFWSDDLKIPFLFRLCELIHVFRVCEIFRYFWDRSILWAKCSLISGRIDGLLRMIFGKLCVFPVKHLLENWITA